MCVARFSQVDRSRLSRENPVVAVRVALMDVVADGRVRRTLLVTSSNDRGEFVLRGFEPPEGHVFIVEVALPPSRDRARSAKGHDVPALEAGQALEGFNFTLATFLSCSRMVSVRP